jgi:hypothetical protein
VSNSVLLASKFTAPVLVALLLSVLAALSAATLQAWNGHTPIDAPAHLLVYPQAQWPLVLRIASAIIAVIAGWTVLSTNRAP